MGNLAFLSFVFGILCGMSLERGREYWMNYVFAVSYAALALGLYWNQA